MESNIKFFEHVLSERECHTLIHYLLYGVNTSHSLDYNKLLRTNALDHEIIKKLGKQYNILIDRAFVMKYEKGHGSPLHSDNYSIESGDVVNHQWKYSAVIFLNQEFAGGELIYPDQGIIIKPVTGNMVIAPADESSPHFVNPPTADRYVLVLRII